MTDYTIITDNGFSRHDWDDQSYLELNGDDDLAEVDINFDQVSRIIITFGGAHDGRGFSLGRALREMGFKGQLRAKGPLVTDQWRHLTQTGFDSLMLTPAQVEKMPLEAWQEVQELDLPNYQARVFAKT